MFVLSKLTCCVRFRLQHVIMRLRSSFFQSIVVVVFYLVLQFRFSFRTFTPESEESRFLRSPLKDAWAQIFCFREHKGESISGEPSLPDHFLRRDGANGTFGSWREENPQHGFVWSSMWLKFDPRYPLLIHVCVTLPTVRRTFF